MYINYFQMQCDAILLPLSFGKKDNLAIFTLGVKFCPHLHCFNLTLLQLLQIHPGIMESRIRASVYYHILYFTVSWA